MQQPELERAAASRSHTTARATAPGDISQNQVAERFGALGHQFRHDNTIEPLAPAPGDEVRIRATSGDAMPLVRAALYFTTDGSAPDQQSPSLGMPAVSVDWHPETGFVTRYQVVLPPQPLGTTVRYRIGGWTVGHAGSEPDVWAQDGQGFWFTFPPETGITTFAYRVVAPGAPLPEWAASTVMYQIFLDRFHPGTADGAFTGPDGPRDRHGGTLNGVRAALPYLTELGVNCLWLSPHGESETYHRYDTIDYFAVDHALGTADDLRALVREAHGRGMRLILDFVPSHSSWRHPAFVAARADRRAPTADWFTFYEWPDRYRSFLDHAKYLPSFNTSNPDARAHLIEAARYWITEFEVDGFRLDHAIAPSMDFWVAFQNGTEEACPHVLNFGEATDSPDCLRRYRGKLNGTLDFPLATAFRACFAEGEWDVVEFDTFLRSYSRFMQDGPGRLSFLDNHDMERFLYKAGQDVERLKMAAICQFTLEPVPIIYYGTEVGMSHTHSFREQGYGGDAEARKNMPWDQSHWNTELLEFYRRLIRIRTTEAALHHGATCTLLADRRRGAYAYRREGARPITAVFNTSAEPQPIALSAEAHEVLVASRTGIELRGQGLLLPPRSAAILAAPHSATP